jgi:glycosyltransferase involved in cell wall biosynthesis
VTSYSVVIPAHNAATSLQQVLQALAEQEPPPDEVIVVDDASSDDTSAVAERAGARVLRSERPAFAGGARNAGWEAARSDVVVFLDADAVPGPGWGQGLARALREFPGAIVGCARQFTGRSPWGWVAHLQVETPFLPRGEPREVPFVSSYCMAVPRELPVRFDVSYGGEDAVFCIDALAAGARLVFDPRFYAVHEHDRSSFRDLRSQQRRLAFGLARCGPSQREGVSKRIFSRVPVHYFALIRLALIYRRLAGDPRLRAVFLRQLPRMVVAEWALGWSALRYVLRRPPFRQATSDVFRREAR